MRFYYVRTIVGTLVRFEVRHIRDVQISRLRHDLSISVNDRVILSFREDLIFTNLRTNAKFRENKTLVKISNLHYSMFQFQVIVVPR